MIDEALEKLKNLGTLGGFGDLVFTVRPWPFKTMTFKDANHSSSVEYAKHKNIGGKPSLEFIAEELDEVSLNIELLSQFMGENPLKTVKILRGYMKDGDVYDLVLGDEVLGEFVITKVDKKYEEIDCFGNVQKMTLSVSFMEYN